MDEARAKRVFLDALDRPAHERADFVAGACAGQPALAATVRRLLSADERADGVEAGEAPGALPLDGQFVGARARELGPGEAVGAYVLRRKLGEGGFGIVWQARQHAPVRREVALKVLKPGMDTAAVLARFEAERQALARMEHPGICKVHDAGTTPDGRPYFVMELFDGETLTRYCEERELGLKARLRLFGAVCDAVQHAHHKGVIHRDLKPSNVLVRTLDGRPTPKVIDFGVAKATDRPLSDTPSVTLAGQFLGTPAYMSPEQASGSADVDMRSDVYALGALLYEVLCGAPPFDPRGAALAITLRRIQEDDPPRPSQALGARAGRPDTAGVRAIPDDLDWIVMRCLEKDRERRYASAYDLHADLQRFLRHQPVEAAPPSPIYKLRKLARRHRVLVATSSAVLLALVVGMIGMLHGLRAARRAGLELELEARNARAAEGRAAHEAREASRQARISEAVLAFLNEDLLAAVGPSSEPGRGTGVLMGDVLDEASLRIERESLPGGRFADEPLVEAAIRDTIGGTYRTLGRYRDATPHLRRALELRVAELGCDDPAALLSRARLAAALRRTGGLKECAELLDPFVDLWTAPIEGFGVEELITLREVGLLHDRQGRPAQAARCFERALEQARPAGVASAELIRGLRNGLAVALAALGRHAEAEPHFRACHEETLQSRGPDDPDTLAAAINLGAFLLERQDLDAAAGLLERAVESHHHVYGSDHPQTAEALIDLGILRRGQGRLEESAEVIEQAFLTLDQELAPGEPATLLAMIQLARTLAAQGAEGHAEALVLDARERATWSLPEGHPLQSSLRKELADLWYHDPARGPELEALMDQDLRANRRVLGADHASTLRAMVNLAQLHDREGREAEAEALFFEALERSRAGRGADDVETLLTASDVVVFLAGNGRSDEALALAEDSVARAERVLDPGSEALAIVRLRYGACLLDHARHAAAERPLREAQAVLTRQRHAGDPLVRAVSASLAEICEATGRSQEATAWVARAEAE